MLQRYTIMKDGDFELTRAAHALRGVVMEPVGKRGADGFRGSAAQVLNPLVSLHVASYSADVRLKVPPQVDDYLIPVPTRPNAAGGVDLLDMTAGIATPERADSIVVPGGVVLMGAVLPRDAIDAHAWHLFGDDLRGPVAFQFEIDSSQRGMRAMGNLIKLIIEEEADAPHILTDPRRMTAFRDSLVSTMLLFCPHSGSALLARPSAAPAPRDVRRVVDFIRAHSGRALSLADLVAVAGVPGRTLNDHFRAFIGLSPMAYLKRARLRRAHELLQAGEAASVTDAALEAGFTHLGRFARDYSEMFGVPPSQTLRQGRRH